MGENRLAQILHKKDQFLSEGETLIYLSENSVIARHHDGETLSEITIDLGREKIGKNSRADSIAVIKEMIDSGKLNGEEFIALSLALVELGE